MPNDQAINPNDEENRNIAKTSKGYDKDTCPFCNNSRENCASKQGLALHKAIEDYLEKFYTNNGSL